MRTTKSRELQNSRFKVVLFGAALALGAAGCSKKKKSDDNNNTAPKPKTVEVTAAVDDTTDGAFIKYKSDSHKDATFQCQVAQRDINSGAEVITQNWQECPEGGLTVAKIPGQMVTVRIKAVAKDGKESSVTERHIFPGSGAGAGGGDGNGGSGSRDGGGTDGGDATNAQLTTVILNKSDVQSIYRQKNLVLRFGVASSVPGVAPSQQLVFECRRESTPTFRVCGDMNSPEYDFGELRDANEYSLTVRAVDPTTGMRGTEDSVSFRVALEGLVVRDIERLTEAASNRSTETIRLGFANIDTLGGSSVTCVLDPGAMNYDLGCSTNGLDIALQGMPVGSHTIRIEVKNGDSVVSKKDVPFCYGQCDGAAEQSTQMEMKVGSFLYRLPEGDHLTSYSTATVPAAENYFLQILRSSDPGFHTVRTCNTHVFDRQRQVTLGNYEYCESSMTWDEFKTVTNGGYAMEHMETATADGSERVLINSFSNGWDFDYTKSFFHRLCGRGSMYGQTEVKVTGEMRMAHDYWQIGAFQRAELFFCDVKLTDTGIDPVTGELRLRTQLWWVGAFYLELDNDVLPDVKCFQNGLGWRDATAGIYCDQYSSPNLVEVVYAVRSDVVNNAHVTHPNEPRLAEYMSDEARFAFLTSLRFKTGLYRIQ